MRVRRASTSVPTTAPTPIAPIRKPRPREPLMEDIVGEERRSAPGSAYPPSVAAAISPSTRRTSWCCQAYRKPSTRCSHGDSAPAGSNFGSRIVSRPAITARKLMPLIRKQTPSPTAATSKPGDARAQHPGRIEHGRVQRDGVEQVFLAGHVDDQRLPPGHVEGVDDAQQAAERENVPDLHAARRASARPARTPATSTASA